MTNLPTVEEMQKWKKRYKLDDSGKAVIDTVDGGEYWTIHGNEAYNLCIDMNKLHDENKELKKENGQLKQENQSWLITTSYFNNIAHKERKYAKRMHKENKELKEEIKDWEKHIGDVKREDLDKVFKMSIYVIAESFEYYRKKIKENHLNTIEKENEQLKSDNKNYVKRYGELFDEYTKLKEKNKELKIENDLLSDELEQAKAVINKKWNEYLKKKELI